MKVKELIEMLNKVDPEMEVLKRFYDGFGDMESAPVSPSIETRFKICEGVYVDEDTGYDPDCSFVFVVEL